MAVRAKLLVRVLVLVAAGFLALLVVLFALLHLPPVQRALWARATAAVEAASGVRLEAGSFELSLRRGRLELERPSAAAGAAEPFLTASRLVVEVAPTSMVRGPLRVREVTLEEPRYDGSRPLPELPAAGDGDEVAVTPEVSVERFTIRAGSAVGFVLPAAAEPVVSAARIEDFDAEGRLRDGRLQLSWSAARLTAERPPGEPLELRVEGALEGPLAGPLELESLRLAGPALSARASGRLGLAADQPLAVELELEADPARLLGVAAGGGPLRARADLDLRAPGGVVRLEAPELAAELLRPWLDAELYRQAGLAGTVVALDSELRLAGGELRGDAELGWRRGRQPLAALTLAVSGDPEVAVDAEIALELLPDDPGRRALAASLRLPLEDPGAGVIESGRLELAVPDLTAEIARLRALWPAWVPELPAGAATGGLLAEATFAGSLRDPESRLTGRWSPAAGGRAAFEARGRPLSRRLSARLGLEQVPLALLEPAAETEIQGVLDGEIEAELRGERLAGAARLAASGVAAAGVELDRVALDASLAGDRVELRELVAAAGERRLGASGTIRLGGEPAAELALDLSGPLGPLASAAGRLILAAGVLELEVPRAEIAGGSGALTLRAPLAALARLPGAAALAELPLGTPADGPLEIGWLLPEADWAAALGLAPDPGGEPAPPEAADEPPARLWRVGSRGTLRLDPAQPAAASGEIELGGLALHEGGRRLSAAEPLRLRLADGRLTLEPVTLLADGQEVELAAEAGLRAGWMLADPPAELLDTARLTAGTAAPEPFERLAVTLSLTGGRVDLEAEGRLTDGGRARLTAETTLAALLDAPAGGERPVRLALEVPAADWSGLLGEPREEDEVRRLVAGLAGRLEVDLARPTLATGELAVPTLEAELSGQSIRAEEPVRLRLGGARLEIAAARLLAAGAPLELTGRVELEPGWRPGEAGPGPVRRVELSGGGVVPAALANPFLAGGAGEGALVADLELAGPPDGLRGELRLRGPGAEFYFVAPYAVVADSPELLLELTGARVAMRGGATLNEGRLELSGELDPEKGLDLRAQLEGVRARLDYGLLTVLDGDLRLELGPDGGGRLSGRIEVDRGELTRPMRLDSLVLGQLLAPADLIGTEWDPLEGITLDLTLATREGVRVRNNLADLKARWEPIAVRGTLALPLIEGRLEVDPGGLVYVYGQTVRIDSAALVYRGLPDELPELELETTTSLEDPSIGRLAGDLLAAERGAGAPAGAPAEDPLGGVLGAFLGEQLAGSLGDSLGGASISFRAPLIFGETDPGARFTVARDVSPYATLAASVDLRNAERQTYLLDLHGFAAAPLLTAQTFTNDLAEEGATLQQRLELGGTRVRRTGPRLRRLEIDRVPGVRPRRLRRAAGVDKGDHLPSGAEFDVAVEVAEYLRTRGYPDARVRASRQPTARADRVELAVRIDPGPRVEFRFTGESLPRPLRHLVTALYRGDFYEATAIEEMRAEAVRAWRSRGHPQPKVTISREVLAEGPPERRRVTIDSQPGERLGSLALEFAGLPPAEATDLTALFATRLQRIELAAGLEGAERRALGGLAALGYPDARLVARELAAEEGRLTVTIEPGERLRIERLELIERDGGLATEVAEAGGLAAGDPARADRLARAALEVERQLRDSGYLDAEVRVRLEPLGEDRPSARRAVFELDRGARYRLGEVELEGLRATRPRWAVRQTGLEPDETLTPEALRMARRRLYGTGLFSAVGSSTELDPDGGARVSFEVQEKPRLRLAYGVRWESEEGSSVVVDLFDQNLLGRGIDFGARALWADDIQRLRLTTVIPGVAGRRSQLELFALAGRKEELVEEGEVLDVTRTWEGTVQLGWQLGRHTTGRVYGRYRRVLFTETFLVEDPFFGPLDPIEIELRLPFLGLQYIFDSRDDRAAPRRGLFASADLSVSDEALGSDIRYGRLFGQLNSFRPAGRLAGRELTWAQSLRLGRAEAFSGQELLGDLLLLAGGEYSVRGYRRESLGPPRLLDPVLPSVTENTLFVLNEELRVSLGETFDGLLFVDAGNVWLDDSELGGRLFWSLGLGLRAVTPVGLLRLDVAYPLDARAGIDPDVKVYFGLGNVF